MEPAIRLIFPAWNKSCAWHECSKETDLSACAPCEAVSYCSKEHQKADWPRHKAECPKKKDEYNKYLKKVAQELLLMQVDVSNHTLQTDSAREEFDTEREKEIRLQSAARYREFLKTLQADSDGESVFLVTEGILNMPQWERRLAAKYPNKEEFIKRRERLLQIHDLACKAKPDLQILIKKNTKSKDLQFFIRLLSNLEKKPNYRAIPTYVQLEESLPFYENLHQIDRNILSKCLFGGKDKQLVLKELHQVIATCPLEEAQQRLNNWKKFEKYFPLYFTLSEQARKVIAGKS